MSWVAMRLTSGHAHHLVDGTRHEVRTGGEELPRRRVRREQRQRVGELVLGRVAAGEQDRHDDVTELGPAQPIAILLGVHQDPDQVVARSAAPSADQPLGHRVQAGQRLLDRRQVLGDLHAERQAEIGRQRRTSARSSVGMSMRSDSTAIG